MPTPAGTRAGYVDTSPGRLHVRCMWLKFLAELAYIQNADLSASGWTKPSSAPMSGGPVWIESDLYSIEATAEGTPGTRMMLGPMLQALLEERFGLRIQRDTKPIPVYELRTADGGFKLKPLPPDGCVPQDQAPPPTPGTIGQNRVCGVARGGRKGSLINMTLTGHTMADLAAHLELDRLVIDKTGIAGLFDISLSFGNDGVVTQRMFPKQQQPADPVDPTGGPSVFTALQEQLGLRLVPATGPGTFLIITSVQRPTAN